MNGIPTWLIVAVVILIIVLLVGGSCSLGNFRFSGGG